MSWFRIDDKSAFHRKVLKAGNEAWGAICRAGAVSAGEGTDGRVTKETMLAIAPMKVWQRAIAAGLVDRIDDTSFQLHDYLQWNESASEIEARAAARRKKSQDAAEARWGARGRLRTPEQPAADAEAMPGECPEHAAGMQEALPQAHTPSCPIPIHTVPERSSIQKPPPPQLPPEPRASAPAGVGGGGSKESKSPDERPGEHETTLAILAALKRHPALAEAASIRFARYIAERHCSEHPRNMLTESSSQIHPLADVVQCIDEASEAIELDEAANNVVDPAPQRRISGFVRSGPKRKATARRGQGSGDSEPYTPQMAPPDYESFSP